MHEMSLCEAVLQTIEQQALKQDFGRVTTICLEIGALAAIDTDALRLCFEIVVRGSLAEHARLEILSIAGSGYCQDCRQEVEVQQLYDQCPRCAGVRLDIINGQQMRIKYLEVA